MTQRALVVVIASAIAALSPACGKLDSGEMAPAPMAVVEEMAQRESAGGAPEGAFGNEDGRMLAKQAAAKPMALEPDEAMPATVAPASPEGERPPEPEAQAAPTRAWFPETLLFEPLVTTDENGKAQVPVRVPDRLTTWRVLALAHSRAGAQAGAVARFVGTLPTYVDVVVPPFLHAGDKALVPVQVVNTTEEPAAGKLVVDVTGAARAKPLARALTVPKGGSHTELVELVAAAPGAVVVRAAFGSDDAVERTIPVKSAGRPGHVEHAGTLAAPRSFTLTLPDKIDDGSARVRLTVTPGALGLLRAELDAAPARSGIDDDAYLLALSGRAPSLAAALGAHVDEKALKRMRSIASQRALKHARVPDTTTAARFAAAALSHEGSPVLERLGERLMEQIAAAQRPDGTFLGGDGWSLARVLVATASMVRALEARVETPVARRRAQRARLLASGAFERYLSRVDDAYTAAAIVASGAVDGAVQGKLLELVERAIVQRSDGARTLPVPDGAQRLDGSTPSETEATALAVLALRGSKSAAALLPDLGAALLSSYRGGRGFGDGQTNLCAFDAVIELFREGVPAAVAVSLSVDGAVVAQGALEGQKLREALSFTAPLGGARGGARAIVVEAKPSVAGLGFLVELDYAEPWPDKTKAAGLDLVVERDKQMAVGEPLHVTLRAAAPGGAGLVVRHALPAGMMIDAPSLDALVAERVIERYVASEGALELHAPPRAQGDAFVARYRLLPTLAGTLAAGASSLWSKRAPSRVVFVKSEPWVIEP